MKLGIDLGGSHIAIALINEQNQMIAKLEENLTLEEKQQMEMILVPKINQITNQLLIREHGTIEQIEQVGVACPRNHPRRGNY